MVAPDADARRSRATGRRPRRARARSPRRRPAARPRPPRGSPPAPLRGPRRWHGCPRGRRRAPGERSAGVPAGPLGRASQRAPPALAGIPRKAGVDAPARSDDDEPVGLQARHGGVHDLHRPARRASSAAPRPRAPRPAAGASRRRGCRRAPRAAAPPRPARPARDRPRGHRRPRLAVAGVVGQRLGPDGLRGDRRPSPVASITVARKPTFLATESTSRARSAGSAAASGRPGKPPPLPRSRSGVIPRARRSGTTAQAVDDVGEGHRGGLADRGQVDRRRPGQQEPDVAVDRGPGLGVEPRPSGLEPRREGVAVRLGELGKVRNARRERTSRPVQGTLLKSCTGPSGSRSRRRSFAAALRPFRSRAVRSVPARVSP